MTRLVIILVLIAVVVVVVMVASRRAGLPRKAPKREDPRAILKRRYAAGEIDEDEYLRRMSGLSQDW